MDACLRCSAPFETKTKRHYCAECRLLVDRELRLLMMQRALVGGRCRNCFQPRGPGGTKNHCYACSVHVNERARARRDGLIARGLCSKCMLERGEDGTTTFCAACARDHSRGRKERRAESWPSRSSS